MRKLTAMAVVASTYLVPGAVMAQAIEEDDIPTITPPTEAGFTLSEAIVNVINAILVIAGSLAVLFLIIGGIRYIISAGNSDQIEGARHTIFNAIIGIVVILLALIIVNTLNNFITGA